jgi:CRP-like cAMP-binding protein
MTNNTKIYMVDEDTGRVMKDFDADTHYIRSKKQSNAFVERLNGRNSELTFTNREAVQEVIDQLEDTECGYLLYLQCFIGYDGKLVQRNHDKTPMTKTDIQDTLELGRTKFTEYFNRMLSLGIIYEADGYFYVNQRFHFRGTSDNQKVIRSFTTKVRQLYTKKNAKDLGFVYKLLPFVHYETNTLCHNPFEPDPRQIMKMSQQDIADVIGTDRVTVNRKMKRLTLGDEYLFAEVNVGKKNCYMLNPFVFYRKQGKPDATLQTIFAIRL